MKIVNEDFREFMSLWVKFVPVWVVCVACLLIAGKPVLAVFLVITWLMTVSTIYGMCRLGTYIKERRAKSI